MSTYTTPEKCNKFNPNILVENVQPVKEHYFIVFGNIVFGTYSSFGGKKIVGIISKIIGKEIPVCPNICILGLLPLALSLKIHEQKFINLFLLHITHHILKKYSWSIFITRDKRIIFLFSNGETHLFIQIK